MANLQTYLCEAHDVVDARVVDVPITEGFYFLVDEVHVLFKAHFNLFFQERKPDSELHLPVSCLSNFGVDVTFLVVVVVPEPEANHIDFVVLLEHFVGEGDECAFLPEGEQELRVGSMGQLVVEIFLVREFHLHDGDHRVLKELLVGKTFGDFLLHHVFLHFLGFLQNLDIVGGPKDIELF